MIEFKIDNTGDNVEDLVIQCVYKSGKMYIYGPVKPSTTWFIKYRSGYGFRSCACYALWCIIANGSHIERVA